MKRRHKKPSCDSHATQWRRDKLRLTACPCEYHQAVLGGPRPCTCEWHRTANIAYSSDSSDSSEHHRPRLSCCEYHRDFASSNDSNSWDSSSSTSEEESSCRSEVENSTDRHFGRTQNAADSFPRELESDVHFSSPSSQGSVEHDLVPSDACHEEPHHKRWENADKSFPPGNNDVSLNMPVSSRDSDPDASQEGDIDMIQSCISVELQPAALAQNEWDEGTSSDSEEGPDTIKMYLQESSDSSSGEESNSNSSQGSVAGSSDASWEIGSSSGEDMDPEHPARPGGDGDPDSDDDSDGEDPGHGDGD